MKFQKEYRIWIQINFGFYLDIIFLSNVSENIWWLVVKFAKHFKKGLPWERVKDNTGFYPIEKLFI